MEYQFEVAGKTIATDKAGYLLNVEDWQAEIAPTLAQTENIELTDNHWEVVNFVRQFYLEFNTSPAMCA
jgi:tRNA 2-thiouridine synthesizing protein E